MSWFGRSKRAEEPPDAVGRLERTVRAHMAATDDSTVRVVASVAGLLAGVAYADRDFGEAEAEMIRATLGRIPGLGAAGASAVLGLLREIAAEAKAVHASRFTRILREELDRDGRIEILDLLVDLSAADGTILTTETNFIRHVATGLGLTQADYNMSQARHRDKLAVLAETPGK